MWYMGCVLYLLCSRKPAFDATSFELLRKNISETNLNTDLIKRNYSPQMMTCIKSLLSINPEDRIATQDLMNTQFIHKYINGISYNNNKQYRINITDRQQDNQQEFYYKLINGLNSETKEDIIFTNLMTAKRQVGKDVGKDNIGIIQSIIRMKEYKNRKISNLLNSLIKGKVELVQLVSIINDKEEQLVKALAGTSSQYSVQLQQL